MITVKNIQTSELVKVSSLRKVNDTICSYHDFSEPSDRWLAKYPCVTKTAVTVEDKKYGVQCRVFSVSLGWELVKTSHKTSKKDRKDVKKDTTEVKTKTPRKSLKKDTEKSTEVKKDKKYEHPAFRTLLKLVQNDRGLGRSPWLFGPAGSGKSTLCEAVAKELGLPFYSVSSLQQKYELEGYTDAAGEYVETTFFKAAKEGGIFLFDEASTTAPEVQIAFNSMLANLWYNFPKHGMITAHPDFHVIAADNTAGRGADSTYSARFALDASTLDRYITLKIGYTDEHDLHMAHGDVEFVTFLKGVREAIDDTKTTYLASPRTSKTLKYMQEEMSDSFSETDALYLSLCSGWTPQDIKTIYTATAQHVPADNRYLKTFKKIAEAQK